MQFADYSPPSSPSPDSQRDALQKGQGRAVQWARSRRLEDAPLLEACLEDLRFDSQAEGSRSDWLWQILREVNAVDRFRVPILHALYDHPDEGSADQLCELGRHYAETGDMAFRQQLYTIVEKKPIADRPWLGEEEIIQLDGERGFLFAARVRGRHLAEREWEWDDASLVQNASERFGEDRVNTLLAQANDRAIEAYREGWHRHQENAKRLPRTTHRERMRAIPVRDILAAAESHKPQFYLFRGWGMFAEETDLELILQRLWSTSDPTVIANLLRVFSNRSVPQFDDRLLQLCEHSDPEVRQRALIALEKIEHQLIREYALAELERGIRAGSVVRLFVRNYQRGDERRILESVEIPDDDCEVHWLLMDVIKVLETNPDADCSRLGVIVYASTPCENCRFYAARLLLGQHVAPDWLIEECRLDSNEDCRELVTGITGSS